MYTLSVKIDQYFRDLTGIYPLVTFRIVFGLAMLIGTLRTVWLGWIDDHYLKPIFHFTYYGFEWVKPLGQPGMYVIFALMAIAAICIAIGYLYRLACVVFFFTFTYTELIDLTYYLNHYYFVSIVSFLLFFLPANANYSLDTALGWQKKTATIPRWCIDILKLHVALVYVYAGFAKMNYDWLVNAMPLRIWLPSNDYMPVLGPLLRQEWIAYAFSWTGMLYDTTVPFFLLWKRTRWIAYFFVVLFHCITGWMFQIGIFPLVMIGCTWIYFSENFHKNLLSYLPATPLPQISPLPVWATFRSKGVQWVLAVFVVFQVLFPWRYIFYPGNLFWTEEGYRFSWRVMLVEKAGLATFYVRDRKTGAEAEVINSQFLNTHQEKQMSFQPDLILQFAHFLHTYYIKKGVNDPIIRTECYVTMNGRPGQLFINPLTDLSLEKESFLPKKWILPFVENE